MTPLRRHQLAYLSDAGWAAVLACDWDEQARACIAHWASRHLPLVVTQQPVQRDDAEPAVALGLPAPARWGRRRLALRVPRAVLLWLDEFPRAAEVLALLPLQARPAWRALTGALAASYAPARVYGSVGWQHLSGLQYLHAGSDLDLWVAVDDADHADAVASLLQGFPAKQPRLDGELVFDDGTSVAWREWIAWRAGQARSVLVRRLHGAAVAREPIRPHTAGALESAA